MLAPFDPVNQPAAGGTWPQIVVVQSRQVFRVSRVNCQITNSSISVQNSNVYDYLKRAHNSGQTIVIVRIYPSPGDFLESVTDPNWDNPDLRGPDRTMLSGQGETPLDESECNNEGRFRSIDDVGNEMLAIQNYATTNGWSIDAFEPANEPNIEWYGRPSPNGNDPNPNFTQNASWYDLDDYFGNLYDYVRTQPGSPDILTPPMAQNADAEDTYELGTTYPCGPMDTHGYQLMTRTFNSSLPDNDGYSWHNYFRQTKETYQVCPYGEHVSTAFPTQMSNNIHNGRPAYITESDLYPVQDGHGNSITNKVSQDVATANSIRDFLYYEATASSGRGAQRIAAWLLNDDCTTTDTECQKHLWAEAYDSHSGVNKFRSWFNLWWYGPEPHVP